MLRLFGEMPCPGNSRVTLPYTDSARHMGTYEEEDKQWLLAHAGVLIWRGPVHNAQRGANQRCTSLLKRVGLVVVWTPDDKI